MQNVAIVEQVKENVVTKLAFATEELYRLALEETRP